MSSIRKALSTSVGQKVLTALTGIALVGFVIIHLLGNLTLLAPNGDAFNAYAAKLDALGPLKLVAEFGLIALFGAHIVNGILLKKDHVAARPIAYKGGYQTKKGPSKSNPSSRNMIISGTILLAFLILHIWQFRFGPAQAEGYVTSIDGEEVRDLYLLIVETFSSPLMVATYVGVMAFLAAHLRHGIWSMFQSLGLIRGQSSVKFYAVSAVLALLLGVGFLLLPVFLYLNHV
jgi:succinate dehydrogenase / fumarate reductase cytochrome b subunit